MGAVATPRVFLDANILFSAALGGPAFELLWLLEAQARVSLHSSAYCLIEARYNLERKKPAALPKLERLLKQVNVQSYTAQIDALSTSLHKQTRLPDKDWPVYAAALVAGTTVLLTGDVHHFGHLIEKPLNHRPRVMTLRQFLLQGP